MKIKGVSIWIWAASIVVIGCGVYWMAAFSKTPTASEDAVKCHSAAREMLKSEREAVVDIAISKIMSPDLFERTAAKSARTNSQIAEKQGRAYAKLLGRLKDNESMMHRESAAIEKWVSDARGMIHRLPKKTAELSRVAEKADKEWEIFMEQDMIDLLKQ